MAEIELSAMTRQWLNRRIPDLHTLTSEIAPWNQHKNPQNLKDY
ncbi:hypothetical protein [Moorena sp. SIOASIH]